MSANHHLSILKWSWFIQHSLGLEFRKSGFSYQLSYTFSGGLCRQVTKAHCALVCLLQAGVMLQPFLLARVLPCLLTLQSLGRGGQKCTSTKSNISDLILPDFSRYYCHTKSEGCVYIDSLTHSQVPVSDLSQRCARAPRSLDCFAFAYENLSSGSLGLLSLEV